MDLRELVELILSTYGNRVRAVADGKQALQAIEKRMPDLILLDMRMPGMNGCEFASAFHSRWNEGCPIVVVTAAENPRALAAEVNADGWIGKPFSAAEMTSVVDRFSRSGEAAG